MISEQQFTECLRGENNDWSTWAKGRAPNLFRIFSPLYKVSEKIAGPTLDVASGGGIWFRALRDFIPRALPYSITEIKEGEFVIDGQKIGCVKFECEKDTLPFPDNSFGLVLFCDVLEHLLVDPMWPLLEFNRILRVGGHLVISTPNACGASRMMRILSGLNPASENEYKPMALYQRHNREYTPKEVIGLLLNAGFDTIEATTNTQLLNELERAYLNLARTARLTTIEDTFFGPEIVTVATKKCNLSLSSPLPEEQRWPDWLYSGHKNYHQRPKQFPVIVADDYA